LPLPPSLPLFAAVQALRKKLCLLLVCIEQPIYWNIYYFYQSIYLLSVSKHENILIFRQQLHGTISKLHRLTIHPRPLCDLRCLGHYRLHLSGFDGLYLLHRLVGLDFGCLGGLLSLLTLITTDAGIALSPSLLRFAISDQLPLAT
jgi:hypothetical protein